jgi:FAD/FMN-containing dehydrogenase/DNA-binding HxlR family transcriptional regulator
LPGLKVWEDTAAMKGYGQFCPVARASEVIAERWTPIIVRNLLLGATTFNDIASGAPGLSRALLTKRLRELHQAGVIDISPKPQGHGSRYQLTQAGRDLWGVLSAMGGWALKWMELTPEQSDPDVVLWSWCYSFLRRDRLPDGRALVRFDFKAGRKGRPIRVWLLLEDGDGELCAKYPGFEEDLVVVIEDSEAFARWHLGLLEWSDAVTSGGIRMEGRRDVARVLPTWNAGPEAHRAWRKEHDRAPVPSPSPSLETAARSQAARRSPGRRGSIPHFGGWILTPADADYEEARRVWNGAIDRRPALIAGCGSQEDVAAALAFARDRGLPIAVRGGGHGVAGTAVCDDGLVIDLSPLKSVAVDPLAGTVRAGAGVVWGELDAATQAFGLATTGGQMSETGIAGLTLGGGLGWLMRRHGLTVDNLLSTEVVLADGDPITADANEHPHLFWGLRGGGGNFGVVTSFTYRLHPVGPEVLAGPVLWAQEDAADVLGFYREFVADAPAELNTMVLLRRAPAVPFLPAELHGRPVIIVAMLGLGPAEQAERLLAPMRGFGRPLIDMVGPRPYTALQSMFDAGVRPGWHYYWKSAEVGPLTDRVIDVVVDHSSRIRSPLSYSIMFQLGGAVADVPEHGTAYAHRDACHAINVNGVWLPHQPIADQETEWTRRYFADLEPHQVGAYVNFLDRDEPERVRVAFGEETYRRLQAVKTQYDPGNVFRLNHNIEPLARVEAGTGALR